MTFAPGLAGAVAQLGTESAFDVLARARALEAGGRDVIHLEIGEPDFPTPTHISEAAFAAIRVGETHYCPSAGLPEFRRVIAEEMSRTRHVAIPAERVLVANGAKPILFFTILAVCEAGDEVVSIRGSRSTNRRSVMREPNRYPCRCTRPGASASTRPSSALGSTTARSS